MTQVAVLVPGIMGSVLKLGNEVIWPGPVSSLVLPYKLMAKLMLDGLEATDCIREYFIADQYKTLIDDLEMCGFREQDKTLVIAAYDWRKDNAKSAETLARIIDGTVEAHGPNTEVSLVAHSMGGLVSRYYLESGSFATYPGFTRVRRLITLGTPHEGAALALPLVLGYEKRLFLNKDQVLQLCSDPRYPAAYQLLPPSTHPFAWDGRDGAELKPGDVYSSATADALGLVSDNLKAAQRFRQALGLHKRPDHVRYFCFAGTRQRTTTHVLLRPLPVGRLEAMKIERDDGGDGTVPTWSGFSSGLQLMFVGGEHGTIYANLELRRALAKLLGKEGVLAGVPDRVEVSVRDRVVRPADLVHLSISFPRGLVEFVGVLTIERAQLEPKTGRVLRFDAPTKVCSIQYTGAALETISVVFEAPNIRGAYRMAFRDDLAAPPAGADELIVQEVEPSA